MSFGKHIGIVWILLSAVSFSTAGVLIKLVPWNAMSINGARCVFAIIPIYLYLRATGRHFHVNKQIVVGAAFYALMLTTFVAANKLTTAANAIVLQFTEPIWVILGGALIWRNKPTKAALIACAVVLAGIVCFFFDQLTPSGLAGNLIAIVSGIAYAGVFFLKKIPGCDFECAAILGFAICVVLGGPFYVQEIVFDLQIFMSLLALGIVQLGLSVILLSRGLATVSPVTASLVSTIEPILNPILVAVTMGELIGPISLLGAVLVLCAATGYSIYSAKLEHHEDFSEDKADKAAAGEG